MKTMNDGFTALELLVVLTICGLIMTVGISNLYRASSSLRLRMAAGEIASSLRLAHSWAIRHGSRVAVKYSHSSDGTVRFGLYRDGDGDGVRNRDIESGADPAVRPLSDLAHVGAAIRFGFPPHIVPRDPSDTHRALGRLGDPIRFNRSDLASFDPMGTATPGTVYLTDGRRGLAAVRVNHQSARVRIMIYDADEEVWH